MSGVTSKKLFELCDDDDPEIFELSTNKLPTTTCVGDFVLKHVCVPPAERGGRVG